jgi:hypothetical protein
MALYTQLTRRAGPSLKLTNFPARSSAIHSYGIACGRSLTATWCTSRLRPPRASIGPAAGQDHWPIPDPPQHATDIKVADLARIPGHFLVMPPAGLRPGSALTLTLYYRATARTPGDYTCFVQLYSPVLGMVAQQDSLP